MRFLTCLGGHRIAIAPFVSPFVANAVGAGWTPDSTFATEPRDTHKDRS